MSKSYFKGVTMGALLAAAATLLLAPHSGKKTRKDVQKFVDKLSKKIIKETSQLQKVGKKKYEEIVKTTVGEYAKKNKLGKGFVDDISKTLLSRWADVKKQLNDGK